MLTSNAKIGAILPSNIDNCFLPLVAEYVYALQCNPNLLGANLSDAIFRAKNNRISIATAEILAAEIMKIYKEVCSSKKIA